MPCRSWVAVALGGVVILAGACTDESSDPSADSGPNDLTLIDQGVGLDQGPLPDQDEVQASPLVVALCEVLDRCEDQLGKTFADTADCEGYFSRRYGCGSTSGAVDKVASDRCLGWLAEVTCEDGILAFGCIALARPLDCADPLLQWGQRGAPGCAHVYTAPAAAEGEACEELPCAEGLYCKLGPTKAICPVCRALAGLGEQCLYNPILPTHHPCAPGLYCAADRKCAPRLAADQPCEVNRACASGFCRDEVCADPFGAGEQLELPPLDQCKGFLVARQGACAPRLGEGEPCTYDVDCTLDAVCVGGKCQPREVCAARGAGEPCVTEPLGCVPGTFCNNTATPQLCETVHGLGEPCEFTEDCGDDAYCSLTGQQCTAYSASGESCAGALLCAKSLYCDLDAGETCAPQQQDSSPCDYSFQCLSGYCDSETSSCGPSPPCTMP